MVSSGPAWRSSHPNPDGHPSIRATVPEGALRPAILRGLLASAATAVLGVELLSSVGLVRQLPLLLLSAATVLTFVLVLRRSRGTGPINWSRPAHPILLGALVLIGATTLLVALVAPPNSWDSMTYHMARVAQWYDHGNVEHYYTAIDRQLWQPPFGEYLVLLGYGGLGGRDYLANLPQWLAGVGAVLVVMEIAALLGASPRSRYIVALFTATAPAIILQSSSTLTDLLGGFWVACAAWLALRQYLTPMFAARDALWFGLALGLAIGTKGTSIPLGLPWAVLFLLPALRPFRPRTAARQAAAIGLVILVLAGSHYLRNVATFGSPFGPDAIQRMLRPASMEVPSLLSNFVAHLSLQIGTPWAGANTLITQAVAAIHSALGVDLSVLYPYFGGFRIFGWNFLEDLAGNPVHTVLGMASMALLLGSRRKLTRSERFVVAGYIAGVILFVCTVRWQLFIARLHTPMLILLSPCLLLLLDRRYPRATSIGLAAALLLALPPLVMNPSRPIFPPESIGWQGGRVKSILVESRQAQYFANRLQLYQPYRSAIDSLTGLGCGRVTLVAAYDSWEYPLWALGRHVDLHFENLGSARTEPSSEEATSGTPCAVVGLDQKEGWIPPLRVRRALPVYSESPLIVWH